MEERGKNALPALVKAIEAAGGPLAALDEAARVAVVQRFEEAEPDLFGWVKDAAYIAYYENPFVAEAINSRSPLRAAPAHQRLSYAALRSGARHPATRARALHEDVGRPPRRHQRPRPREQPNPSLGPEAMTKSQDCDVLIVGAGATGALAATVLAQGGLDVLCLEQGAWVEPGDHPHYSSDWTWQRRTNWNSDVNKRHHPDDYPVETNSSQVLMWNGVGGSTNVYGAIWPRYRPSDFRKGDEHGLQPNWPISYEDLAPFYEKADRLIGTSGLAGDLAMPPRDRAPRGRCPSPRRRPARRGFRQARLALVARRGWRHLGEL